MTDGAPIEAKTEAFDDLLEFLKLNRGFDFTGYKRSSLERRIRKRMQEIGVETFSDYQDHLEVHPDEFRELFNTICINVTGFFRDKESWDYLVADILPPLIAAIPAREPVRVWCAGCASGEEAYTTAIVLAEALGLQRYAERVKIYATVVVDVGGVDLDPLGVPLQPQRLGKNDGGGVRLLAGGAARAPDPHGLAGRYRSDQRRKDVGDQVVPGLLVAEEPGDVDADRVEQLAKLVRVDLEVVLVVREGLDADLLHALADAPFQARALVAREVEPTVELQELQQVVERLGLGLDRCAVGHPIT